MNVYDRHWDNYVINAKVTLLGMSLLCLRLSNKKVRMNRNSFWDISVILWAINSATLMDIL